MTAHSPDDVAPPASSLVRLAAASARIHGAATLSELLRGVAEEARALIGAHQAVTSLTDDETGLQTVSTVSMSAKYDAWAAYDEAPRGKGIYTLPCLTNRSMRFSQADLEAHPAWQGFGEAKTRHPPMRGWLAAPFVGRDGGNLGLVQLSDRHEGEFSEDDEAMLVQLAAMAAVAIENIRLLERIKASEAAAKTAEGRLMDAIDALPDAFAVFDEQDRIVVANRKFQTVGSDIVGMTFEQLLNHTADNVLHPSMAPDGIQAWKDWRYARHRNPQGAFEQHYRDGRWTMIWERRTRDGQTVFIRNDITALKQAQGEAQAARRQIEQMLLASPDMICLIDADMRYVEISSRCRDIVGFGREELIGRRYLDFAHPGDIGVLQENREAVRERGERRTFDVRHRHRDGSFVSMQWAAVLSPVDGLTVAIGRDTTEQKRLAERVRQIERLEAVGQLTGGVAHDFNNLLTIILGNAEFLASRLGEQPRLQALASMMRQAAERGADLTARLQAFAQQQPIEPRAVDVNVLAADMLPLLRRSIGAHVDIDLVLSPDLGTALTDPAQLQTALANLCLNARDAMPDGGRITIETGHAILPAGPAGEAAGPHVRIAVADTGTGMPADVLARVFEPFFTTREVGKGTGLGLSMVYGFVRQNGGRIEIDSEPGLGTVVRLYLPDAGEAAAAPGVPPADTTAPPSATRVLLVEDDPLVRMHVEALLADLDLDITVAESGAAAVALLETGRTFDLLFTDIVMPGGTNGFATAEAAQRLLPGIKVILTSGYSDKAGIPGGSGSTLPMLKKPYRRQQLVETIRRVMAS